MSKHDDRDWIRQAIAQHEGALILYAHRLSGNAESAREIVQDVFLTLCEQERVAISDHLAQWLYTVCRNRCFDRRKKEKRMTALDEPHQRTLASNALTGAQALERQQTQNTVLDFVATLPENQQEVLRLKFQSGFSYRQIADITGLSEANVGFLLSTALKTIRGCVRL
jgi:RNA polymerase sigma factor (sigma-70 family)